MKLDWDWNHPALRAVFALDRPCAIGIDGRCGSGKTSLADELAARLPCRVIHADDYYLPPAQRIPDWQHIPAANMDLERLRREVLASAARGEAVTVRAYRCADGDYAEPAVLAPAPVTIVEGSYSCHPALERYYDMTLFITCSSAVQAARIRAREGERANAFFERWIPLEEAYFQQTALPGRCGFVLDTSR